MRYPRHMTLELTAKCNFRCPYCYCVWHEYPALAKPELDLDQWKAVLDQCAADGVDDILFTGGEALLRSDMFAILDHARRILPRARLSLFTNASRLDETLIKRFRREAFRATVERADAKLVQGGFEGLVSGAGMDFISALQRNCKLRRLDPLYRCVFALPVGDLVRCPVKWLHLAELSLAALAAWGIAPCVVARS